MENFKYISIDTKRESVCTVYWKNLYSYDTDTCLRSST